MSDLFDIKPGSKTNIKVNKKAEKAAKKESATKEQIKERRKTKIISISVISVLLLAFIGALIINSNFIRREIPVITINNVGFSAAEFDYYYISVYMDYRRKIEHEMPESVHYMLPQRHIPLGQQVNQMTGEYWDAYFIELTIEAMSDIAQRYTRARASGFVLPDDAREEMEAEIEWQYQLAEWNHHDSLDSFLRTIHGPSMNKATFVRITEMGTIASAYEQSKIPEFTFTQEEIDEYYNENRRDLDVYTMRLFSIQSGVDDALMTEDMPPEEALEITQRALEEAKAQAEEIVSAIETEEDFIAMSIEHNQFGFTDPDFSLQTSQGEFLSESLLEWLSNANRQYGDVASIVDESDVVQIIYFIDRDDNSYLLTNFRQLLFMRDPMMILSPENFPDEADYLAEFDNLDSIAYAHARDFEGMFIELGANEAAIDRLVSDHEYMNLDGNLYSNIAKLQIEATSQDRISTMQVVPEIEAWLFDPTRQVGDFELIRTEAFGFHLLYFTGFGERFSNVIADNRLNERETRLAHEAWLETLDPVSYSKSGLFSILTNIESFM